MLSDLKAECEQLKKIQKYLLNIINICKKYIEQNYNEFYDENGINLLEIQNYLLYLKNNLNKEDNRKKIIEMQNRLLKAINWAANNHIYLTQQQLQGKKIELKNERIVINSNYEVPIIEGLFIECVQLKQIFNSSLSYLPPHMREIDFCRIDYFTLTKEISRLVDEYSLKILKKEAKRFN